MLFDQNKLISLKQLTILFVFKLTIVASNCALASSSSSNNPINIFFDMIGTALGIGTTDASYNNVNISSGIVNNLASSMFQKNSNRYASNIVDFADHSPTNDACGNFCYHMVSSKNNKITKKYSKVTNKMFHSNISTNLGDLLNFAAGYGFANSKLKLYERETDNSIGQDNINTHLAILSGYAGFSIINTNLSLIAGSSKHNIDTNIINHHHYDSHFVSGNLNTEIELDLLLFTINLLLNAAVTKVSTDATKIKLDITKTLSTGMSTNIVDIPKANNNLCNFGLAVTTHNNISLQLVELGYRLSLGYNFSYIKGTIINPNSFFQQQSQIMTPIDLPIPTIAPTMHKLVAEINLSLKVYQYLRFGVDYSYAYGNLTDEYAVTASVSYLF